MILNSRQSVCSLLPLRGLIASLPLDLVVFSAFRVIVFKQNKFSTLALLWFDYIITGNWPVFVQDIFFKRQLCGQNSL